MHRPLRLVLVLLIVTACADPAAAPSALQGRVLDAMSGEPVAGALLRVEGTRAFARTDPDGRYELEIPVGAARAVVDAPGYLQTTRVALGEGDVLLHPASRSGADVDAYLERLGRRQLERDDPSDPALRLEAAALLRGAHADAPPIHAAPDVGGARAALIEPPATIRVWRRRLDGASASCEGRVDVIPLEDYVKGVLPHEWIASWDVESLRAGALAIRTYAWRWILRGGKYDCADLDDTSRSQVYRDERLARTDDAVDVTRGQAIARGELLVSGSYSAENGDPTANGVSDPLCAGREVNGHGRGMCQRGSQRWAAAGHDHVWIAEHYYPGATVVGGAAGTEEPLAPEVLLFDAELLAQDLPETMRAGETRSAFVELRNTGSEPWVEGQVWLRARSPAGSAFHDPETWIDERRVATIELAPDGVARIEFVLRAPDVTSEATLVEELTLAVEEGAAFGSDVVLAITVEPPPLVRDAGASDAGRGVAPDVTPAPPIPPSDSGCGVSAAGSSARSGAILALVAVLGRRRVRRRDRDSRRGA